MPRKAHFIAKHVADQHFYDRIFDKRMEAAMKRAQEQANDDDFVVDLVRDDEDSREAVAAAEVPQVVRITNTQDGQNIVNQSVHRMNTQALRDAMVAAGDMEFATMLSPACNAMIDAQDFREAVVAVDSGMESQDVRQACRAVEGIRRMDALDFTRVECQQSSAGSRASSVDDLDELTSVRSLREALDRFQ